MTPATPLPTPAHHAALTLHALGGADRQWVLNALSGEQQAALGPLLQELEELGIPREPELARTLLPEDAHEDRHAVGTLQSLDAAGVRRLAALLCAEPPRMAAALLASQPWPWRDQLLAELPPGFARAVDRTAAGVTDAGSLQAAVVAELAPCVWEAANPRTPSLWQAMRRRLRAMRGRR
jgi:hypothetical protein